jgi:alpha-beta hydrolase superfamily lysophospholipase
MQDIFYTSKDGKTTVHACLWLPAGEVKGIVQIIHGMAEYAERYNLFARYLTDSGYVVCAEDHLGHGKSVTSNDQLGYFVKGNGEDIVLADIRQLTQIAKEKFPNVPYFVLGHSMGSFFTRKYISIYGNDIDGVVIMGTGYQSGFVTGFAKFLTKLIATFKGWQHRSKLINDLAFGPYNKRCEKRTYFDWLSKNEQNVDNYIADQLCGIPFTCSGFYTLFSVLSTACKSKTIKAVPDDLPVFLVSGKDDPVGNYGKGVIKLYDKLDKSGVKALSMTLYADCRHEILNDNCSPQVMQDVLEFFDNNLKSEEGNAKTEE